MFRKLQVKAVCGKIRMQESVKRLIKGEAGGAELIATLVIIGIVLILAFAFKDKLTGLVKSIWNNLVASGNESTTQQNVASTWT